MAAMRRAPWPTKWATFTAGRTDASASRYWPKLCQRRSSEAPMPPAHPFTTSSCPGASGAWEKEHMPTTSVVTPWRTFDSADGHAK